MATNPIGKGTKNVTVNMPEELKKALQELADASGLSLGHYIRAVLADAKKEQIKYQARMERIQE